MKKGGGSEFTIIIGPSKSVLVYTLHSFEYGLGLARFRVFVPKFLKKLYGSVCGRGLIKVYPIAHSSKALF